ncbi:MAG: hypothetical protein ABI411_00205 [Tahibacter sp.]
MYKSAIIAFSAFAAFLAVTVQAQAQDQAQHRSELQTQDGTVEVHWGQPTVAEPGPKPAFAELDRDHNGSIDENEALAYPPLANDFILTDRDRNGSISAREYQR